MQAARGESLAQVRLAILDGGSLAKHRFGEVERAPRDVDHRRLEMREREVGIELHGARQGAQTLVTPRRVCDAEVMAPVAGLERHGTSRRQQSLLRPPRTHQEK